MHALQEATEALKKTLGDFLDRGREDGVFFVQAGGPGSVPALSDLDVPELHVDVLPGELSEQQRSGLLQVGYVPDSGHWVHPGGWRLVFPDHGTGWRAEQQALASLLSADNGAAAGYRHVFEAQGRRAADHAFADAALRHHARTVGFSPAEFIAQTLAPLDAPWMFAAGVALDLHLGRVARPHDDVDIVFPRERQPDLLALLRAGGWRTDAPLDGTYQPWTAPLEPPHHQVHARHPDLPDVILADFMFTDLSGERWHYRRDPGITLPLSEARRHAENGLPYLAPQAALLFKSATSGGQPRPKDEQDFRRSLPTLSTPEKEWLAQQVARTTAQHPWLAALER
ncbi:nucleotidyltransferase domain-containing protein [Deinococcus fonticola]|uniref:nucleotidyltransferase domain-containing protein n=1 Tax=Deinococcus fonticola TaxID=2528713 RepID=UPI0010749F13|nr:hypothetical protein [Deinococcus fonticola]